MIKYWPILCYEIDHSSFYKLDCYHKLKNKLKMTRDFTRKVSTYNTEAKGKRVVPKLEITVLNYMRPMDEFIANFSKKT
jgi:hypothetical protein